MDMITNTVETNSQLVSSQTSPRLVPLPFAGKLSTFVLPLALFGVLSLRPSAALAAPTNTGWSPLFKGINLALGTNEPSGSFPRLQVVRCVRIDLTDPDIQLFTTPRASNYAAESRESLTLTVPHFLKQNNLQIACDANFYNAFPGGSDPTSEGVSCEVYGLQICTGAVVSAEITGDAPGHPRYASVLFTTNNHPSMVFVNSPPGTNTAGIYNAVTGYYPVVSNGVNIGAAAPISYPDPGVNGVNPRTALGISQDNRYLFILTIDGRQTGYSDGALDTETAYWMIQFGAWNAISMDGGGSTALYTADSAGNPIGLNHSSYLAAFGHERYVGSHFGVYAKPLPGFINNVSVLSDDTAATVTWTTLDPATTQVQYGQTTNLGSYSTLLPATVTNHAALLTNLIPATSYYFQIIAKTATAQYVSSNFLFTTSNYVTSTSLFDLTNVWTFTTDDLDGVNWTAPTYDDSNWIGSGPGLFWADILGFPNSEIPAPVLTQIPLDPNTAAPYTTYYFRTHFPFGNKTNGVTLLSTNFLDDGAVFYLNGAEIYRLRMPPLPAPIVNATSAPSQTCPNSLSPGDAVCADGWSVSGDFLTNLVVGDNVLAVEVHNYSAGGFPSHAVTFGMALDYTEPNYVPPQLSIQQSNSALTVSWSRGGFTLQQAGSPAGPWTNAPGPVVSSPFSMTNSSAPLYFRLIK